MLLNQRIFNCPLSPVSAHTSPKKPSFLQQLYLCTSWHYSVFIKEADLKIFF